MENYDTTQDERLWGMLSYLLTFFGFLGFLGPLVVYVVKRGQSRFIAFHTLQAIFLDVLVTVVFFLAQMFFHWAPELVFFLVGALICVTFIYTVVGAIKAWDGEWYQMPCIGGWAMYQSGVNRDAGGD